ncbi:MAG: hypothetical protein OER85_20400 [Gammaproteobacteria bacterium]|nr:hypothetical protein [Gammaproteobacteria bacterium]
MNMKKMLTLVTIMSLSTNTVAAAGFLCITDLVSGFHYDEERATWQQATFLPGERFEINERREGVYELKKLDTEKGWSAQCTARTDLSEDSFSCSSGTNQFHFNKKLLRFTSLRFFGYWNGSNDSLSMSMGQCFPN